MLDLHVYHLIGLLRINKILNARLWPDGDKAWQKSVAELGYEVLLVSQFTLYGVLQKGASPPLAPSTVVISFSPSRPASPFASSLVHARSCSFSCFLSGRKPDFHAAMPPALAREFYSKFVAAVRKSYGEEKVKGTPHASS